MTQPWKDPDLSGVWEVSEITDPSAFVRFVVERAPVGSTWIVSAIFEPRTIEVLKPWATEPLGDPPRHLFGLIGGSFSDVQIPLMPEAKSALLSKWSTFDFGTEFTEQHVYTGNRPFLVSYDNLTCCWLTKEVPETELEEAGARIGFSFSDPTAAEPGVAR